MEESPVRENQEQNLNEEVNVKNPSATSSKHTSLPQSPKKGSPQKEKEISPMSQDLKEFEPLIPQVVQHLRNVQTKSGNKVTLFHLTADLRKPVMLSALDLQMLQGKVPFEKMVDAEELATTIYFQAFKEKEGVEESANIRNKLEGLFTSFKEEVCTLIDNAQTELLRLTKIDDNLAFQYFENFRKGLLDEGDKHKGYLNRLLRHLAHFDNQDKQTFVDCSSDLKVGLDAISRAFSKHVNKLLVKIVPETKPPGSDVEFAIDPIKLNAPKLLFSLDSRICVANRGIAVNPVKSGNALVITSNGRVRNFQINTKPPGMNGLSHPHKGSSESTTIFEKRFEVVNTGYNIASFSPNGESIVVCGYENAPIKVVKSEDGSEISSFLVRYEKISGILWTTNTALLLAIEGGTLVNHDIEPDGALTENVTPIKRNQIPTLGHDICHMILANPGDSKIICGNTSGTIFACDYNTGLVPWKKKVHTRNVSYVSRSSNGLLASGGIDNNIVVMDETNQNEKFRKTMGNTIIGVEWTPECNYLVVGTREELCIVDGVKGASVISSLFQPAFSNPYHLQSFTVDWKIQTILVGTRESDESGKIWKVGMWELNG